MWTSSVNWPAQAADPPIICIDPGHPSDYSAGTTAPDGLTEVEVNWWMALALKQELLARGLRVVLTKSTLKQNVSNKRRAEIANETGSSLFLRLHCDAVDSSGFSVYYPKAAGTRDGHTGPPADVRAASGRAAKAVHSVLRAQLGQVLRDRGLLTDRQTAVGAKQGALTGSIYARVPVVTVEMVVLTNARDAAWIRLRDNRIAYAKALADGIERFLDSEER